MAVNSTAFLCPTHRTNETKEMSKEALHLNLTFSFHFLLSPSSSLCVHRLPVGRSCVLLSPEAFPAPPSSSSLFLTNQKESHNHKTNHILHNITIVTHLPIRILVMMMVLAHGIVTIRIRSGHNAITVDLQIY